MASFCLVWNFILLSCTFVLCEPQIGSSYAIHGKDQGDKSKISCSDIIAALNQSKPYTTLAHEKLNTKLKQCSVGVKKLREKLQTCESGKILSNPGVITVPSKSKSIGQTAVFTTSPDEELNLKLTQCKAGVKRLLEKLESCQSEVLTTHKVVIITEQTSPEPANQTGDFTTLSDKKIYLKLTQCKAGINKLRQKFETCKSEEPTAHKQGLLIVPTRPKSADSDKELELKLTQCKIGVNKLREKIKYCQSDKIKTCKQVIITMPATLKQVNMTTIFTPTTDEFESKLTQCKAGVNKLREKLDTCKSEEPATDRPDISTVRSTLELVNRTGSFTNALDEELNSKLKQCNSGVKTLRDKLEACKAEVFTTAAPDTVAVSKSATITDEELESKIKQCKIGVKKLREKRETCKPEEPTGCKPDVSTVPTSTKPLNRTEYFTNASDEQLTLKFKQCRAGVKKLQEKLETCKTEVTITPAPETITTNKSTTITDKEFESKLTQCKSGVKQLREKLETCKLEETATFTPVTITRPATAKPPIPTTATDEELNLQLKQCSAGVKKLRKKLETCKAEIMTTAAPVTVTTSKSATISDEILESQLAQCKTGVKKLREKLEICKAEENTTITPVFRAKSAKPIPLNSTNATDEELTSKLKQCSAGVKKLRKKLKTCKTEVMTTSAPETVSTIESVTDEDNTLELKLTQCKAGVKKLREKLETCKVEETATITPLITTKSSTPIPLNRTTGTDEELNLQLKQCSVGVKKLRKKLETCKNEVMTTTAPETVTTSKTVTVTDEELESKLTQCKYGVKKLREKLETCKVEERATLTQATTTKPTTAKPSIRTTATDEELNLQLKQCSVGVKKLRKKLETCKAEVMTTAAPETVTTSKSATNIDETLELKLTECKVGVKKLRGKLETCKLEKTATFTPVTTTKPTTAKPPIRTTATDEELNLQLKQCSAGVKKLRKKLETCKNEIMTTTAPETVTTSSTATVTDEELESQLTQCKYGVKKLREKLETCKLEETATFTPATTTKPTAAKPPIRTTATDEELNLQLKQCSAGVKKLREKLETCKAEVMTTAAPVTVTTSKSATITDERLVSQLVQCKTGVKKLRKKLETCKAEVMTTVLLTTSKSTTFKQDLPTTTKPVPSKEEEQINSQLSQCKYAVKKLKEKLETCTVELTQTTPSTSIPEVTRPITTKEIASEETTETTTPTTFKVTTSTTETTTTTAKTTPSTTAKTTTTTEKRTTTTTKKTTPSTVKVTTVRTTIPSHVTKTKPEALGRKVYEEILWKEEDCNEGRNKYIPLGNCFRSSNGYGNQKWSERWCTYVRGYKLITINSWEKQVALKKYARENFEGMDYWMSAIDKDKDGQLFWRSTGQRVKYTNFAPDVAVKSGPHPCLMIDRVTLQWHDRDCKTGGYAMCGKVFRDKNVKFINPKKILPTAKPTVVRKGMCDDDKMIYTPRGHCFWSSDLYRTYGTRQQSEGWCHKFGGKPIVINSREKQEDLKAYTKETAAIVKNLERMNFWMSPIDKDADGYLYWRSTGEKVKYVNFAADVVNKLGPHPCLIIDWKTLQWHDRNCISGGFFLCEKGPKDKNVKSITPQMVQPKAKPSNDKKGMCDGDKMINTPGGHCFWSSDLYRTHGTRQQSDKWCHNFSGKPISINSREKQEDLKAYVKETSAIVKKLERLDFWMSPIDKDENGYLYWRSTGEKVKYTNFAGDVVNKLGPHPCLIIDWRTLQWHDRNCISGGFFMCEKVSKDKNVELIKPKMVKPKPKPTNDIKDICNGEKMIYTPRGYCFWSSEDYRTYGSRQQSDQWCHKFSGKPTSINSLEKQEDLKGYIKETADLVKNYKGMDYWISPIDKDANGYLYWRSTGEKVKYTNFANDVSDKFGPHPCLKIDWKTLLWYDRDCLTAGLFLCEKGNTPSKDKDVELKKPKMVQSKPKPANVRKVSKDKNVEMIHQKLSLPKTKTTNDRKGICDDAKMIYNPRGYCFWSSDVYGTYGSRQQSDGWCHNLKGQLISINSWEKQEDLKAYVKEKSESVKHLERMDYWMSSIDRDANGYLYWRSTGERVKYTNFANDVVDKSGPHPCLLFDWKTLQWHDRNCNTGALFMCEKVFRGESSEQLKPTLAMQKTRKIYKDISWTKVFVPFVLLCATEAQKASDSVCTKDKRIYIPEGNCFWSSNGYGTQKASEVWCSSTRGYKPVTVNDWQKLVAVIKYSRDHFLGGNYWMSSIDKDEKGELYWRSTGQKLKYTNFGNDVIDKKGPHPCLMIDRITLRWHDRDCNTGGYFMCEKVY